jgi:hypothetical protein
MRLVIKMLLGSAMMMQLCSAAIQNPDECGRSAATTEEDESLRDDLRKAMRLHDIDETVKKIRDLLGIKEKMTPQEKSEVSRRIGLYKEDDSHKTTVLRSAVAKLSYSVIEELLPYVNEAAKKNELQFLVMTVMGGRENPYEYDDTFQRIVVLFRSAWDAVINDLSQLLVNNIVAAKAFYCLLNIKQDYLQSQKITSSDKQTSLCGDCHLTYENPVGNRVCPRCGGSPTHDRVKFDDDYFPVSSHIRQSLCKRCDYSYDDPRHEYDCPRCKKGDNVVPLQEVIVKFPSSLLTPEGRASFHDKFLRRRITSTTLVPARKIHWWICPECRYRISGDKCEKCNTRRPGMPLAPVISPAPDLSAHETISAQQPKIKISFCRECSLYYEDPEDNRLCPRCGSDSTNRTPAGMSKLPVCSAIKQSFCCNCTMSFDDPQNDRNCPRCEKRDNVGPLKGIARHPAIPPSPAPRSTRTQHPTHDLMGPFGLIKAAQSEQEEKKTWACPQCTYESPFDHPTCDICGTLRPEVQQVAPSAPAPVEPQQRFQQRVWMCPQCGQANEIAQRRITCGNCGYKRKR